MQPQINAIKQLLETNNITAGQIEEILVKALGDRASWEDSSTCNELADIEDKFEKDEAEIPLEIRWILESLWRSRIDLNDAKLNAEKVNLEDFLAMFDGATQVAESRLKQVLSLEKQLEDRDRTILELELALKSCVDGQIAKDPESFKNIADGIMLAKLADRTIKIEDRDRVIALLKTDFIALPRIENLRTIKIVKLKNSKSPLKIIEICLTTSSRILE